jgi:chromosomal replication initiation ATPase DnaA
MRRTKNGRGVTAISPYVYVGIRPNDLPKNIRVRLKFLKRRYSIDIITSAIKKVTKITHQQLGRKDRHRDVTEARKMYCYFVKQKMNLSLKEIGNSIGRDHTTIIHNIEVFKDLYETDQDFKSKADEVLELIETNSLDNL